MLKLGEDVNRTVSESTEFPIDGSRRKIGDRYTLQESRSVFGGDFECLKALLAEWVCSMVECRFRYGGVG